ncbi:uncharacterized protein LOC143591946 [Bidens hawaiensis]|uniref:uncharacterized protein LOC143591946 n=1 Tax=Bidens hawaiensis TaxID=980011 RepID=UPI00404A69D4
MWRAFPEVLLIDTAYKTNMYDWQLVQFVGVTSTSKSFYIGHTFIIREKEKNFTWELEKLKELLEDRMEPRVILTDTMQRHLEEMDRHKVWYYIHNNWLEPYKHKFVACCIDDRRNYDEHTTNRVEGQHANLKRYLHGTNNMHDTVARHVLKVVNSQMVQIGGTFEESRSKVMEEYRRHYWLKKLINRVSIMALQLIVKEYHLIESMRDDRASCSHHLFTSTGLPCACRLEGYIVENRCIRLQDLDPF